MPQKGERVGEVKRFIAKINFSGECWTWTGGKNERGYGAFTLDGNSKQVRAHRYAYELWVGPIPNGLHLDHLCRNTGCVRPEHLEAVTCKENLLRGETLNAANAMKSKCLKGHDFDKSNTYITRSGKRYCRKCGCERQKAYKARIKSNLAAS